MVYGRHECNLSIIDESKQFTSLNKNPLRLEWMLIAVIYDFLMRAYKTEHTGTCFIVIASISMANVSKVKDCRYCNWH